MTDPEAVADMLVEMVGHEEASRLIEARKPKKKRGRSDYESMDWLLIILAGVLLEEWRRRLGSSPHGRRLPTPHKLATKIVDMLWEDDEATKWFRSANWKSRQGKCLKEFGADKQTIVKRLLGRSADHWNAALYPEDEHLQELKRDYPEVYALHIKLLPPRAPGSGALVRLFEAVHRQRPDLRLLP